MNALKSGIDAKAQIIRDEKAANLEALKTDYYDRYHPTTPVQRMLVDTLIDAEWFLLRFRVCEAELWEEGVDMPLRPEEEVELGQAFRFQCDYFARLQRRLDSVHRNYRNALHELERLQAGESSAPQPDPVTPTIQTPRRKSGFVPQTALPSDLTHSNPPLPTRQLDP